MGDVEAGEQGGDLPVGEHFGRSYRLMCRAGSLEADGKTERRKDGKTDRRTGGKTERRTGGQEGTMQRPTGESASTASAPAGGRRRFLATCAAGVAVLLVRARPARAEALARPPVGPHPTPRPGITAERVLTREQLADFPNAIPAFDMVREIPEVVDGIRCQCGCADSPGYYSLLSCYEGDAMAKG